MKHLIIVALGCIGMVAFVVIHKNGGAVLIGIALGAWYLLASIARGGGVATLRISQDPGQPRKPGDPAASISMGMAASGIAAGIMANPEYPPSFRMFYTFCFVAGLLIALAFAGKTFLTERRAARAPVEESR